MVSTCNCSADVNDADPTAEYRKAWRKARKEYHCAECGHVIRRGDAYEQATMLCEGGWDTFHTCPVCVQIREDLCPDGFLHGTLSEDVNEGAVASRFDLIRAIYIRNQRIAGLVELVEELSAEVERLKEATS